MIQMALTTEEVTLSDKDVGQTVISEMYQLDATNTVEAANLVSDTTFYASEGYDVETQPSVVETITGWITEAKKAEHSASLLELLHGEEADDRRAELDQEVLNAMPAVAGKLARVGLERYRAERFQQRLEQRSKLYTSATSKLLLDRMLGGVAASDPGSTTTSSAAERAVASGQPAKPETLEFAQWLKNNATTNGGIMNDYCFTYSSESSTATDTFATQIQSMVKKVQSFIGMMEKYATPAGIKRLEDQISYFLTAFETIATKIIMSKVEPLLNKTMPQLEMKVRESAHTAGEKIGEAINDMIKEPILEALNDTLKTAMPESLGATGEKVGSQFATMLSDELSTMSEEVIAAKAGDFLESIFDEAMQKAGEKLDESKGSSSSSSLLELQFEFDALDDDATFTDNLNQLLITFRSLTNLLPTAVSTLKNARTEVAKAAKNLASIFFSLSAKGEPIFKDVSAAWSMLWTLYWALLVPLTLGVLYYGFWASGYFGGPQPIKEEPAIEGPVTFMDRIRTCCTCCCGCWTKFHDTQLCFWSFIILAQIFVLIIFLIAIVLSIVAAVQLFITSGCAQIYVLGDVEVCGSTLSKVQQWLETFHLETVGEVLEEQCEKQALLTCNMIKDEMTGSSIMCVVFSFIATLLSLQMLLDSACLHEMAVWRREAAKLKQDATIKGKS
jgi:hypothetical protein